MKPLRILHIVGSMRRAGIETWLMHVTRNVGRSEFAFDFLLHEPEETAYEAELRELGCRIFRVGVPKRSLRYSGALERRFGGGVWDVVHSHEHHTTGTILRAAARAGIRRRIAHSHNDTRLADDGAGVVRKAFNRLNRSWLARHAHAGFAASAPAATALFGEDWRADGRWLVLPYGIDLVPFRTAVNSNELRASLGIPAGARVVGHVGRFEQQKNHALIVAIAQELLRRDRDLHFLLVGEGRLQPEIVERIERAGMAGSFTILRDRADVPALMLGAMDVFLFPSLYEGLGLVALEAQAAGLPCIMSTAVPRDADVFPSANTRVPLTSHAGEWADAVLGGLRSGRDRDTASRLAVLESSVFSSKCSTETLLNAYEEFAGSCDSSC